MTDSTGLTCYRFRVENGQIGTAIFDHSAAKYKIHFDRGWRHSLTGHYNNPVLRFSGEGAAEDDCERLRRILRAEGTTKWKLEEMVVPSAPPGTYYPRVWRQASGPAPRETYGESFTGNLVAYWNLERDLREILRTLEPATHNDRAYGHQIRNLLILACTEVELLLRQVLRDNGYSSPSGNNRWTTNDYIKAMPALLLGDWGVSFPDYPEYPILWPFKGWNAGQPTGSLSWYQHYNATKHDRDQAFNEASLGTAIAAVGGVLVLLASQFGVGLDRNRFTFAGFERNTFVEDNIQLLHIAQKPVVPLQDQYIPLETGWTRGSYRF